MVSSTTPFLAFVQIIYFLECSTYIWNQLDPVIQNSSSIEIYKRALLKFSRPTSSNVYKIHHPRGLKLLTRLRLGLSHLRQHKFRLNFNDTIDAFCLCRTNCSETTEHFLLYCPIYASFRFILFDNLCNNNILVLPLVWHFGMFCFNNLPKKFNVLENNGKNYFSTKTYNKVSILFILVFNLFY